MPPVGLTMKILHVPFTYFPSPCGGTEVYARALALELEKRGLRNSVAAPGREAERYVADGLPVHRLPVEPAPELPTLHGRGDARAAAAFDAVLEAEKPDVVHFHAYSPAVSVRCVAAAAARGVPAVYTYHTPTLSCQRGDLMRWGAQVCDGELRPLRCAACALHGRGVPKPVAWLLAAASPLTGALVAKAPLAMVPLLRRDRAAVAAWLRGMRRVVALCGWGAEVLQRLGVPPARLALVRHGLTQSCSAPPPPPTPAMRPPGPLRVGFFGRLDRGKGLHVLRHALDLLPGLEVELHCHLITQVESAAAREVREWSARDGRVRLLAPVPVDEVVTAMRGLDLLVVPSIWLETGPLVVLEAFAAGVPVLGSDLGGIPEWVRPGINGLLAPAGDAHAWAAELKRFAEDEALRARLRAGVQAPPLMAGVADAMVKVYQDVMAECRAEGRAAP